MSTRSTIAIERKDGTRTAIYCHYDGYIEGVGTTLQLAYNTAEKVEKLLALGDISVLRYKTEGSPDEACIAYHRDCGETFAQTDGKNEYNYTFNEAEACWFVSEETCIRESEAEGILGLGYILSYPNRLLLDAILEADYTSVWKPDEYAKTGDEVHKACIEKAIEAREDIIAAEIAEFEAYYRAYCD